MDLKTLTYSSGERNPSWFLSALSKAWCLLSFNIIIFIIIISRTIQTFMRSPSFRLSTPFFTIRLMGALNKNVWCGWIWLELNGFLWGRTISVSLEKNICTSNWSGWPPETNISEAKGVNANELIYEGDQSLQMLARNLMKWFWPLLMQKLIGAHWVKCSLIEQWCDAKICEIGIF